MEAPSLPADVLALVQRAKEEHAAGWLLNAEATWKLAYRLLTRAEDRR